MKIIHISQIPPDLLRRRDNWRYFWSWIPVLGVIYRKFWYINPMNQWLSDNSVDGINHDRR